VSESGIVLKIFGGVSVWLCVGIVIGMGIDRDRILGQRIVWVVLWIL